MADSNGNFIVTAAQEGTGRWVAAGPAYTGPADITSVVMTPNPAAQKIRARIAEKREEYEDYLRHGSIRLREQDLHGLWDVSVCATEVSNYLDGLEFALAAIEGR